MIRFFRSIWIWTACTVVVLAWVPLMGITRLFDRDPRRLRTARWFRMLGRIVAKVNPAWRVHVSGRERIDDTQVYVIVSNHQSLADIPLITHLKLDLKWLAKAELFNFPIFGWMMRISGDIAVERSDRRKAAQALLQCARCLRQRCSVIFFPEGTRSRDGRLLPFNDGPFQLAIRERVPVLPLVVEGSGDALPRNTWMFGGTQDIHLRVLEPVPVEGFGTKECGELREQVRQRMIDELERLRSR